MSDTRDFESLLALLRTERDAKYPSKLEGTAARLASLELVVARLLEALIRRDDNDP